MTQFHEGQEVEVDHMADKTDDLKRERRRARIISVRSNVRTGAPLYTVRFQDSGELGMYPVEHLYHAKEA